MKLLLLLLFAGSAFADTNLGGLSGNDFIQQEMLWIGDHLGLDLGKDRGPSEVTKWTYWEGTLQQRINKQFVYQEVFSTCSSIVVGGHDHPGAPEIPVTSFQYPAALRACETKVVESMRKYGPMGGPPLG